MKRYDFGALWNVFHSKEAVRQVFEGDAVSPPFQTTPKRVYDES